MRSLFMQEFFAYICMLVRFKITQPESFTTMCLEGQQLTELSLMLRNSNNKSLIHLLDAFLKTT